MAVDVDANEVANAAASSGGFEVGFESTFNLVCIDGSPVGLYYLASWRD